MRDLKSIFLYLGTSEQGLNLFRYLGRDLGVKMKGGRERVVGVK